MSPRSGRILLPLVCAVAAVVLFWPSLDGGFVWDDNTLIVADEASIDEWSDVADAFRARSRVGKHHNYFRPLLTASYVLDHVRYGLDPRAFHRTNVWLHALNVALVWSLLFALTNARLPATFGALLFAAHPLQVQAVAWITGRNDMLLLAPLILAFHAHRAWARSSGGRRVALGVGVAALYVVALAAKEIGIVLPLLLLAYDATLGSRDAPPLATRARLYVPLALVGIGYLLLRRMLFDPSTTATAISLPSRVLHSVASFAYYVRNAVLPLGPAPAPFHERMIDPSSASFWGAVAVVLAFASTLVLVRRSHTATFGLAWFVILLLPVLGLVPMSMAILDNRAYPAMAGAALVGAAALVHIGREAGRARVVWTVAAALTLLMGYQTRARVPDFNNALSLWSASVASNPQSAYGRYAYGYALARGGRDPEAIEQLRAALEANREHEDAALELGLALGREGQTGAAIAELEALTQRSPANGRAWNALGVARARTGDRVRAALDLDEAARLLPRDAEVLYNLARVLEANGRLEEAIGLYRRLIELQPAVGAHRERLQRAIARRDASG
ncbi:MAG: tetratricopeptide repeat protein [bacterium]|nr:tetratricopeptide repeat protein [bacterium]